MLKYKGKQLNKDLYKSKDNKENKQAIVYLTTFFFLYRMIRDDIYNRLYILTKLTAFIFKN